MMLSKEEEKSAKKSLSREHRLYFDISEFESYMKKCKNMTRYICFNIQIDEDTVMVMEIDKRVIKKCYSIVKCKRCERHVSETLKMSGIHINDNHDELYKIVKDRISQISYLCNSCVKEIEPKEEDYYKDSIFKIQSEYY